MGDCSPSGLGESLQCTCSVVGIGWGQGGPHNRTARVRQHSRVRYIHKHKVNSRGGFSAMMDSKEQNKHMDEAEHPRDSTNIQGNLFSFFFFFSKIQYHLWKNEVSPYKQAKAAVMNNIHEIERLRKQQQQKTTETQVTQPNKHSSLCTFPGFIKKNIYVP